MITVAVSTPQFWWRAPASRVRAWVPDDPYVEDDRQRWSDRDLVRWGRVTDVIVRVGDALACREWTVDVHDPDYGWVTVIGSPGYLTQAESGIVRAWFSRFDAVRCDPWSTSLADGRHRLWSTLPCFKRRLVPISSDALWFASVTGREEFGEQWASMYARDLDDLGRLEWFNTADPVNAAFRSALVTAASGTIPSPSFTVENPSVVQLRQRSDRQRERVSPPHVERHISPRTGEPILIACDCPVGADHPYMR